MHTTVEEQRYSAPKEFGILQDGTMRVRDALTQKGDFQHLPQLASEMGFWRRNDLPTKRANWLVFTRPQHEVPNFPDGSTIVNSQLAIYETNKSLTRAVLKTSEGFYNPNEEDIFRRDLKVFTKDYIERPRVLGFPSRALTNIFGTMPALVVGTLAGDVIGYGTTGEIVNYGAVAGEAVGPVFYAVLWWLSERSAKGRISAPDQYRVANDANFTLLSERNHVVQTAIQKELYAELRQSDPTLSPDDFLSKIYYQLPPALVLSRFEEIEKKTYSTQPPAIETENTLPSLLGIARILQVA